MGMREMNPFVPHFGLGPNDSMNMFNNMLNIFNNNSFMGSQSTTGEFPGPRNRAPSPFIFGGVPRNNLNNNPMRNNMNNMNMMNNMNNMNMNNMNMMNMNMMNMNMNMMNPNNPMNMNMNMMNPNNPMNMMNPFNIFINNMNNMMPISFSDFSLDKKDIKRNETLDVKMDVDNILKNKNTLDNKNKDVQYILNYIPFTIIKDAPKAKEDEPHCLICLSNFQVDEKVSALPCFHCFHTKCLDEWIVRKARCPVCKFEITLKNLIGEDIIKEHMKRIETIKKEEDKKEKERKEKERIEKERQEKERKEKERIERERKEKERKEKERIERERKEKEKKEKEEAKKKGVKTNPSYKKVGSHTFNNKSSKKK